MTPTVPTFTQRIWAKIPHGKLAKNATLSLVWQFARILFLSCWVILLARQLGPQGYGIFSGIAGFAIAIGSFTGLGFGLVMYQDVSRNPSLLGELWQKAITIAGLSGVALFILFFASGCFIFPDISKLAILAIGMAELVFSPLITISAFAFSSREKIGWSAALPSLMAVLRLCSLLIFLYLGQKDLELYTWYHLGATALASYAAILFVNKNLGIKKNISKISKSDMTKGLGFSCSWASTNALTTIDKSLVLKLGGADVAGIYGASYRLVSIFIQPIDALINAAIPKLFCYATEKEKVSKTIRYLFLVLITYGILAGAFVWYIQDILLIILGSSFKETIDALKWLTLWLPAYAVRALATNVLMTSDRIKQKIIIELLGLALLFIAGLFLIPQYGVTGSVLMLILTEIVLAILSCAILKRR